MDAGPRLFPVSASLCFNVNMSLSSAVVARNVRNIRNIRNEQGESRDDHPRRLWPRSRAPRDPTVLHPEHSLGKRSILPTPTCSSEKGVQSCKPGLNTHSTPSTVVDLLRIAAVLAPDEVAYVFIEYSEHDERTITYWELHEQASRIAGELSARGARSERALLLFPPGRAARHRGHGLALTRAGRTNW
jgi:hypothetical protein